MGPTLKWDGRLARACSSQRGFLNRRPFPLSTKRRQQHTAGGPQYPPPDCETESRARTHSKKAGGWALSLWPIKPPLSLPPRPSPTNFQPVTPSNLPLLLLPISARFSSRPPHHLSSSSFCPPFNRWSSCPVPFLILLLLPSSFLPTIAIAHFCQPPPWQPAPFPPISSPFWPLFPIPFHGGPFPLFYSSLPVSVPEAQPNIPPSSFPFPASSTFRFFRALLPFPSILANFISFIHLPNSFHDRFPSQN